MQPTTESASEFDDLAQRLVRLEPEGFREFADCFGPRLRAWFRRHGLRMVDAEDLAASSITDIALKVPTHYRSGQVGGFERWVFVLARHALVDWLRTQPSATVVAAEDWLEVGAGDDVSADLDILQAVDEALQGLPDVERAIVEFRDLGVQHDYEEIGQRLRIAAGTARVYHHRALQRLRSRLETDPRIRPLLKSVSPCITSEGHD